MKEHELLDDIRDQTTLLLVGEIGLSNQDAKVAANKLREHIRTHFGGQNFYIPKLNDLTDLDMEIYEKFNGNNHASLAKEYNTTTRHIYRLVKRASEKTIAKRQIDLF